MDLVVCFGASDGAALSLYVYKLVFWGSLVVADLRFSFLGTGWNSLGEIDSEMENIPAILWVVLFIIRLLFPDSMGIYQESFIFFRFSLFWLLDLFLGAFDS